MKKLDDFYSRQNDIFNKGEKKIFELRINNKAKINNKTFKIVKKNYDESKINHFQIEENDFGIFILTLLCFNKLNKDCRYVNIFSIIRKLRNRGIIVDDLKKIKNMILYLSYYDNYNNYYLIDSIDSTSNVIDKGVDPQNWITKNVKIILEALKKKYIYIKLK